MDKLREYEMLGHKLHEHEVKINGIQMQISRLEIERERVSRQVARTANSPSWRKRYEADLASVDAKITQLRSQLETESGLLAKDKLEYVSLEADVREARDLIRLEQERAQLEYQNKVEEFRRVHGRDPRINHCWNCPTQLNELFGITCTDCDWIRCKCGACGCNIPPETRFHPRLI